MPLDWLKKSTSPRPGRGTGRDGRPVVNTDSPSAGLKSDKGLDGKLVVQRRHVDWLEHQIRWRWLLDSFEGGDRYRNAVYGPDRRGLPARNLFRHKREYPDPQMYPNVYQGFAGFLGSVNAQTQDVGYGPYPGMIGADPAATAQDDDYEYRRSRTPVPEFVAEAIEIHLSKVYDQEVSRDGPDDLRRGGGTWTAAARRSTIGCGRHSPRFCWSWAASTSASTIPRRRRARRSSLEPTNCGWVSTVASPATSSPRTWSGGETMRRGVTSNAWSANTRIPRTGSITTGTATRSTRRTRATSARRGDGTTCGIASGDPTSRSCSPSTATT